MLKFLRKTYLWILALPLALSLTGALSNQVVLYVNHDRFPVSVNIIQAHELAPEAIELPDGVVMLDDTHCLMTDKTHLNLLADVFDFHSSIKSIGDLFLGFGYWMWDFAPFVWGAAVVRKLGE